MRRTPGEGRYAHVEREQRWALRRLPDGLFEPTSIVDLYFTGTRLRVRKATAGFEVMYKLGQKVRPEEGSPALVKLTNMYLSQQEYALIRSLPGYELRKTRWRYSGVSRPVVVDEFCGHLTGLVLAEAELGPDEELSDLPGLGGADVTNDDRFTGGCLARLTAEQVTDLFAAVTALLDKPHR